MNEKHLPGHLYNTRAPAQSCPIGLCMVPGNGGKKKHIDIVRAQAKKCQKTRGGVYFAWALRYADILPCSAVPVLYHASQIFLHHQAQLHGFARSRRSSISSIKKSNCLSLIFNLTRVGRSVWELPPLLQVVGHQLGHSSGAEGEGLDSRNSTAPSGTPLPWHRLRPKCADCRCL